MLNVHLKPINDDNKLNILHVQNAKILYSMHYARLTIYDENYDEKYNLSDALISDINIAENEVQISAVGTMNDIVYQVFTDTCENSSEPDLFTKLQIRTAFK